MLLDPDGNVTLKALEQHLYIYESPFYAELIEKAKLTNPTPLTSSGEKITIQHACAEAESPIGFMPCLLLRDYFAPNLRDRTNGQVEFIVRSFRDLDRNPVDVPWILTDGTLDSATFFSRQVGGAMEIQDLLGIYSYREQEFEANQAIIKDIEELVMAGTGGIIMNHSWYSGNDLFIFCKERIDTPDGFAGKHIGFSFSGGTGIGSVDWIAGMGANHLTSSRSGLGVLLQSGYADCALADANLDVWHSVSYGTEYMTGPLPNFDFHNNV